MLEQITKQQAIAGLQSQAIAAVKIVSKTKTFTDTSTKVIDLESLDGRKYEFYGYDHSTYNMYKTAGLI
jgi:hypothetical protein